MKANKKPIDLPRVQQAEAELLEAYRFHGPPSGERLASWTREGMPGVDVPAEGIDLPRPPRGDR